jgi:hypothetical protein
MIETRARPGGAEESKPCESIRDPQRCHYAVPMKDKIAVRFKHNMTRVENLIDIYNASSKSTDAKVKTNARDVLRSAVVFLHAAQEDLLRGLIEYRLPTQPARAYENVPFGNSVKDKGKEKQTKDKITIAELALAKDKSVAEVLQDATKTFLLRKTFNNMADVDDALARMGLRSKKLKLLAEDTLPMMERRHQIVHRADRSDLAEDDHGQKWHIKKDEVVRWKEAVQKFADAMLKACV